MEKDFDQEEAFRVFKGQAVAELAVEKKLAPKWMVEEAADVLRAALKGSGAVPSVEGVEALLCFCREVKVLKWGLAKLPKAHRSKLTSGPLSKTEGYLETRATNLLLKGQKLYANQLAREVEYYYRVPFDVALPVARKVIRRVRIRDLRFRQEETKKRAFRLYAIPTVFFGELLRERIITHKTSEETLRTLGAAIQFFFRVNRLRLI